MAKNSETTIDIKIRTLQGYLVKKARQHHVSVPTLETLVELLKFPENLSLKLTPN